MSKHRAHNGFVGIYAFKMAAAIVNGQVIPGAVGSGLYIGYDFKGTSTETAWRIVEGVYNNVGGSWIFRRDTYCTWRGPYGNPPQGPPAGKYCQCWTAPNIEGGLSYWNSDGNAHENPEDYELFEIEPAQNGLYTIRNNRVSEPPGTYITYTSGTFVCEGNDQNCALFMVLAAQHLREGERSMGGFSEAGEAVQS